MSPLAVAATYFIVWWLVLFAVLPFGVRGQHEVGEVTLGTERGAPEAPLLLRKILATSLIAAAATAAIYVAVAVYGFSLEDLMI